MFQFVKSYMKVFALAFLSFCYINYKISIDRIIYTQDMVLTMAPITAKGTLRNLEEETDMSFYKSESGGMSQAYQDYLVWLQGNNEFQTVVQDLIQGFNDGLTPMNYALPFVDKDKLDKAFDTAYKNQLAEFTGNTYCPIKDIKGSVIKVEKYMNDFSSTRYLWGTGSGFYNNTGSGDTTHERIYDYDKYVTYLVTFHVDVRIGVKYGVTNIDAGDRVISQDVPIVYELVN